MEPPIKPNQEDCCNSGCNPCVFDVYEQQLKLYKSGKELLGTNKENGISKLQYASFTIISIKLVCASHKILSFKRLNQNNNKVWWRPGNHFLYKYNSGSSSCTRAYTPFQLSSQKNEDIDFSIVIKCYDNGLVSNHLFKLEERDLTLWRGPYGSYTMEPNKFNRIIMIAQGTGIAPFITIIERILSNDDDMTKIFLFYCCQTLDEILFRDELYFYRSYWNFSYEVFLSHVTDYKSIKYQEPISIQRFSFEDLNKLKPYSNNQFLICGSIKFMNSYSDAIRDKFDQKENIILF